MGISKWMDTESLKPTLSPIPMPFLLHNLHQTGLLDSFSYYLFTFSYYRQAGTVFCMAGEN